MSPVFYLGAIVLGALVGLASAALGVGGGVLMVPAFLEFVPGMDFHTAKGTSLFVIMFVTAANAWHLHRGLERPPWRLAGALATGSVLGAYGASLGAAHVAAPVLKWFFVGLIGVMMARLFVVTEPRVREDEVHDNPMAAVSIGLLAGIVSGSAGVGGGIVVVPLALLFGLVSNRRVSGLSNLVMAPTSAAAVLGHLRAPQIYTGLPGTIGQVNVYLAVLVVAGAFLGAPAGKIINDRLTYSRRRAALAVLFALIVLRMVSVEMTR